MLRNRAVALPLRAQALSLTTGPFAPGQRDRERLDPLEHILFSELRAVGPRVREAAPCLLTLYVRPGVGDVSQTRGDWWRSPSGQ